MEEDKSDDWDFGKSGGRLRATRKSKSPKTSGRTAPGEDADTATAGEPSRAPRGKKKVKSFKWGDSYSSEERTWTLFFLMVLSLSSIIIWLRVSMPEDLGVWVIVANGVGLGGLVTMIFWLESRSDAFTKSPAWVILGPVTIIGWVAMARLSYSVIEQGTSPLVRAVGGDFVITLYAILAVTSLMLWLSVHFTDVFPAARIRSPWTPAAVVAVVLQMIAFQSTDARWGSAIDSRDAWMYFAEIFAILLVIIGSCVWIYARSSKSILMNVASILTPLILVVVLNYENSEYNIGRNDWLLWHLMLPLVVMIAFWLSSSVVAISRYKFRYILRNVAWIALCMVIAFFVLDLEAGVVDVTHYGGGFGTFRMFQLGFLMFIAAVLLHRDHRSYLERPKVKILKILGKNDEEYKKAMLENDKPMSFNFQVGLFGAMGAGKSSFIFSLWTMMRHTASRRTWWKGEESWITSGNHEQMSNEGKDYLELIKRGAQSKEVPKRTKLKTLLTHRICKQTCKGKIERGELPNPEDTDFPFWADAGASNPESERLLKEHMYDLTTSTSIEAKSTQGTQRFNTIFVDVTFPAQILKTSRGFFGGRPNSEKAYAEMEVEIESLDYPGEYFILAMDYVRFAIKKDRSFVNKGLRGRIDATTLEAVKREDSGIKFTGDDKENLNLVANAITLLLRSHSLYYVADIDRLTDATGGGLEAEGTENFFGVMNDVAKAPGSRLVKVQCLLNKADKLLPQDDGENTKSNLDVDGKNLPKTWVDLLDDDKAKAVLNDLSNNRLDRLHDQGRGPKVGVKFTCTYGGLIEETVEVDGEEEKKPRAPNPFIPVNSMESFLDLILDSEMTPEDR